MAAAYPLCMRLAALVLAAVLAPTARASGPLVTAAAEGTLDARAAALADDLRPRLASLRRTSDPKAIIAPAAERAWAVHLRRVGRPLTDAELAGLQRVAAHPSLLATLGLALTEQDNAAQALAVAGAVAAAHPEAFAAFPELVTAACVVWDSPAAEGESPADTVDRGVAVVGHLVRNRRSLRMDFAQLPWPLLVYVVGTTASADELAWAVHRYPLPTKIGRAFFDVQYDKAAYRTGQWGKRTGAAYTLANLKRLGGVCKDQAHFAAEAARANGVPAVVCVGKTARGGGFHAWFGYLDTGRAGARWDMDSGRYASMGFWTGEVTDPQTGRVITDRDVAMLAEWMRVPVGKRQASLALMACADLADDAGRAKLCEQAVRLAPPNRRAWDGLAAYCATPGVAEEDRRWVADVVGRLALGRYDDFAFQMYARLAESYPPRQRVELLGRMSTLFAKRPDLRAEIELIKGDVIAEAAGVEQAVKHYERVLPRYVDYPPLMLQAMERVDALLGDAGEDEHRLRLFAAAFQSLRAPEKSAFVDVTPWYAIGSRYAELLDAAGDAATAAQVRATLRPRDAG